MSIKPLRPNQVVKAKAQSFPDGVIKAFNDLIVANWDGRKAVILLGDAVKEIALKMNVERTEVTKNRWLDIEDVFRAAGWNVKYDQPGYNESYAPYFVFTEK